MEQMSMYGKFKRVLVQPDAFFKQIKKEKGYLAPWLFSIICMAIFIVIYMPAFLLVMGNDYLSLGLFWLAVIFVFTCIAMVAVSAVTVIVSAGIMHLLLLIVGAKESYHRTFQVVCYSWAPMLLFAPFSYLMLFPAGAIIYLIAAVALGVYSVVIQVKGVRSLHSISSWRAVLGLVIIPIAIFAVLVGAFIAFMAANGGFT